MKRNRWPLWLSRLLPAVREVSARTEENAAKWACVSNEVQAYMPFPCQQLCCEMGSCFDSNSSADAHNSHILRSQA
jgi:hypothetical protein